MKKLIEGKSSIFVLIASLFVAAFFIGKSTTRVLADPPAPQTHLEAGAWGDCVANTPGTCGKDTGTQSATCIEKNGGGQDKDGCNSVGQTVTQKCDIQCKVNICHWDEGSNAYKPPQSESYDSIYKWDNGKDKCVTGGHGEHSLDIIPSFTNGSCSFTGLNTDKVSWVDNGCKAPSTPTDVCKNIPGNQETVPSGDYASDGNCNAKTPVCNDPEATNYQRVNDQTYANNELCEYNNNETIYGCMDPVALNYNKDATAQGEYTCLYATPRPNGDVCTNIDGLQTSVPDGMHINATGHECVNYAVPGANPPPPANGSVLGASTVAGKGQVLGASTMAKTGGFEEILYQAIIGLGGTLTGYGIKNFKKASKKA